MEKDTNIIVGGLQDIFAHSTTYCIMKCEGEGMNPEQEAIYKQLIRDHGTMVTSVVKRFEKKEAKAMIKKDIRKVKNLETAIIFGFKYHESRQIYEIIKNDTDNIEIKAIYDRS